MGKLNFDYTSLAVLKSSLRRLVCLGLLNTLVLMFS